MIDKIHKTMNNHNRLIGTAYHTWNNWFNIQNKK